MSNVTIQLSDKQNLADSRVESLSSGAPTWWLVFLRELHELWIGGKAPILLFIFSILLGGQTYVTASNSELSLMPPNEMVYETLKTAIAVGLFIGLIIGADSLSGERERATLEALLLTPTSRRQLVVGKFLAAISIWPAALIISIPYMYVLAQGDVAFGQAVPLGALLGSILAIAYTGLGMFVSFWSNTNKTSYFVSLGLYILILVPAQLPGRAQAGPTGQFLQWVNPLAANNHFLSKILVNNRTVEEFGIWLLSPIVFALLVLGLLFWFASPGLGLEGGRAIRLRPNWGRVVGLFMAACLMLSLGTTPTMAFQTETSTNPESPLQISINMDYKVVKTTDSILFDTVVTNNGTEELPPVIVAMNIINLDQEGDVVDPEDWSPQRTQYIGQLGPGESTTLSWRVNAILDGDYIVYMVAMPQPAGQEATNQPVASSGIHLTVTPYTKLNPVGILPYAIGGPVVLGLGVFFVYRLRRRQIDLGGSS